MQDNRLGIIDIGSNSVRLVIYEQMETNAYRVIDESKVAARLSEKTDREGNLPDVAVTNLLDTLHHFKRLCEASRTTNIRAVATAAIRNAANGQTMVERIERECGISIEVLSGEEEARLGFLGTINTMDVRNGFLIDIGGGSTEITLFLHRGIVRSVSLPYGAVNMTRLYTSNGAADEVQLAQLRHVLAEALRAEPWLRRHPGLPLVGVGGTVRCLCKINQRARKYSFPITHNYEISAEAAAETLVHLQKMPVEKRKSVDGLSKDRADIIVAGLTILQTVFEHVQASHYIVSGSGLRDGLFFETTRPHNPQINDVLEHSISNLLALHPSLPANHLSQVNRMARALIAVVQPLLPLDERSETLLHVASRLYRIGVSVNYHEYFNHTFYLIANSRIDGLSHREIILCALIASYKTKNKTRNAIAHYKDLLAETDYQLVVLLGTLLHLAVALDRSETQPVRRMQTEIVKKELRLTLFCQYPAQIEIRELADLEKDFKKVWGLRFHIHASND